MSRLNKHDVFVKKEADMKKAILRLLIVALAFVLAACARNAGSATPGNISAPSATPFQVHVSDDGKDVSASYSPHFSSHPWLDTYYMEYYVFSDDGSYRHYADEALAEELGGGSWRVLEDDEGYLSLHLDASEGEDIHMYQLEVYDESIYAFGLDDFIFIWLLCDDAE